MPTLGLSTEINKGFFLLNLIGTTVLREDNLESKLKTILLAKIADFIGECILS